MPSVPSPRSRIPAVDAAKGISILLIVLLHARLVLGGIGVESEAIRRLDDLAVTMRMPLFFAAAGLFAARWLTASWRELFSRKLALLLWVFLIWQPVVFVYRVAEQAFLGGDLRAALGQQLEQLLVSPLRPNSELWFLWALALFFVLAKATARAPAWLTVGIPAAVSFFWLGHIERTMPAATRDALGEGWSRIAAYYVFFVAAAVFAPRAQRLLRALTPGTAALAFGGWVAASIAVVESGYDAPAVPFLLCCAGVVAGFGLGRLLSPMGWVGRVGANTLPVYVAHLAVIVVIAIAIDRAGLARLAGALPEATIVAVAAVSIIAAWWLHRALAATGWGRFMYEPPTPVLRATKVGTASRADGG